MQEKMLYIIDPSTTHAETQGADQIRKLWAGTCRVFTPALIPGDLPDDHPTTAVIMGSRASANDEFEWLGQLRRWVSPILSGDQNTALLGICFGHQLIAQMAGAIVDYTFADQFKLVGIGRSEFGPTRLLPSHCELAVVISHREEVKDVPIGYRAVAQREHVAIDALEHDYLAIASVQFHPEARDNFARSAGFDPLVIDDAVVTDSASVIRTFFQSTLS